MNPADLHRARRVIAQADATIVQRLETIRQHAAAVDLALNRVLIECHDVLKLARSESAKGVDLLPVDTALTLFDLVRTLADQADATCAAADLALIDARARAPVAAALKVA